MKVPLAATLPAPVAVRANVHDPDHERSQTNEDDPAAVHAGHEIVNPFRDDDADDQPPEDISLAWKWPGTVGHLSRVT